MPHLLAQIRVPFVNAVAGDAAINTWSFNAPDGDASDIGQIGQFMEAFYGGIIDRMSPALNFGASEMRVYDRADAEPRTPIFTGTFDLGDGNTGGILPEEVAVCLSFQGVLASGAPPARRRGRVFLGPVSDNCLEGSTRSVINSATLSDIITAYETAWAELTNAGLVHEVWSTTDGVGRTVVTAWVDNAFDTMRSRGQPATTRLTTDGPW